MATRDEWIAYIGYDPGCYGMPKDKAEAIARHNVGLTSPGGKTTVVGICKEKEEKEWRIACGIYMPGRGFEQIWGDAEVYAPKTDLHLTSGLFIPYHLNTYGFDLKVPTAVKPSGTLYTVAPVMAPKARSISDFPHRCPGCGGPAYLGLYKVDCQKKCGAK